MHARSTEFDDTQGLLRFGYGSLTEARFLLLRIADRAAAKQWLRDAPVANAVQRESSPSTALHVAFTREGLEALGVPPPVIAGFSAEFIAGMAGEPSRSRRLGDEGANAPAHWAWGYGDRVPHVAVLLYAKPGGLEPLVREQRLPTAGGAFELVAELGTSDLQGVEPFGFADGISQPTVDWDRVRDPGSGSSTYSNLVALGEFVLGYPNEYGKYTDRPLLDPSDPGAALLPPAENDPARRDVGRNGSYLVIRQLQQDVRGFWQFIDRASGGDADDGEQLAAAMVGRTRDGRPIVPECELAVEGVTRDDEPINRFTFDADAEGLRCPFGAHVRRANPRNADYPSGTEGALAQLKCLLGFSVSGLTDDVIAPTRFHRVLRRGREYGPGLSREDALSPSVPDREEHGIHFMSLGANISRQFEFVQGAWLNSSKFGGLTGENDPLLGTRGPESDAFSIPGANGAPRAVTGLPQFVTVRGGAYFFMPGLRALRYLAG